MPVLVTMPKWGLTMKEGTVTEWLRAEGAAVAAGEPLLVVESDKAANDVEAPAAGTLRKIVAGTGARVPVSDPVAVIALPNETLSDEDVAAFLAEAARRHAAATTERAAATRVAREARPAGRSEEGRINASPAARKLARELGVDLASVQATGPGGRITSEDVERAAAGTAAVREDYVALPGGVRLFYVLAGPAGAVPPLVFLHGLGGSGSTWQTVLADLAAHHRVCALDLPGHGASDKPAPATADYSVAGLARAVGQALDLLGLGQAVLVGHSLGGAVATQVALDRPAAVSRLVLVDSAGLGDELNPALLDWVEAAPSRAEARRLLALFFYDERHVLESAIEETYQQFCSPGAHDAIRAAAAASFTRAGQQTGLPGRMRELRQPVLLLWGAEDRVIPARHARAAAQAIDGAHVEVWENVGHVPQLEAADRFVAALERFLAAPPG
jgi:pyruvate dehydrogenase E2 component (dihydrolipoamide acetyltransferase)